MFPRSRKTNLILLLAILFGLSIVALSIAPVNRVALGTRTESASAADIRIAELRHTAVHLTVFGALAAAAWFAAESRAGKVTGLALTLLLGFGSEYLQHNVFRGPLEIYDVFTNMISSLTVFAILTAFLDRRRGTEAKPPSAPKTT